MVPCDGGMIADTGFGIHSIRRYGDNGPLIIAAEPGLATPAIKQLGAHLFHGRISRFGPDVGVADGMQAKEWLAIGPSVVEQVDRRGPWLASGSSLPVDLACQWI